MKTKLRIGLTFIFFIIAACDRGPELNNDSGKNVSLDKTKLTHPTLLDGAYDPAIWEWQLQPDNHFFLVHKNITKCFVLTDWPMDIWEEEKQKLARTEKALINGEDYTVTTVTRDAGSGEVHYSRNTKPLIHLSVFGSSSCHKEAEKVVVAYEKQRSLTR